MSSALIFFLSLVSFPIPWIGLLLVPRRMAAAPRVRAICIMIGFLQAMFLLEALCPRLYPPDVGLMPFDHAVMLLIPIGAFLAGLCASDFVPTFAFGSMGVALFVPAYCSPAFALAWRLSHGETSLGRIIVGWIVCTLGAGFISFLTSRLAARLKRKPQPAFPPLCPTCHYDLRAHLEGGAGQKCPECGTPIPAPKSATIGSDLQH